MELRPVYFDFVHNFKCQNNPLHILFAVPIQPRYGECVEEANGEEEHEVDRELLVDRSEQVRMKMGNEEMKEVTTEISPPNRSVPPKDEMEEPRLVRDRHCHCENTHHSQ